MVKKVFTTLAVLIIFAASVVGVVYVVNLNFNPPTKQPVTSTDPQPAIPTRLVIPKIGVNARVESVGLTDTGIMDVPKNTNNVAWYNLGVRPGERGNAVIAGHLDTATGPSVFYKLGQLQRGDQILVTDTSNNNYFFQVSDKQTYPYDKVPLNYVFGPSDSYRLNLTTCEGVFDRTTRNYSHRDIIYSELSGTG